MVSEGGAKEKTQKRKRIGGLPIVPWPRGPACLVIQRLEKKP